jgi:hypothetical protein
MEPKDMTAEQLMAEVAMGPCADSECLGRLRAYGRAIAECEKVMHADWSVSGCDSPTAERILAAMSSAKEV